MRRIKNFAKNQNLISRYEAIALFIILVVVFISSLSKTALVVG